jgi:S1-C subfamily serine protease
MTELQARETETWDRAFGWENEGTSIAELREMWENEPEVNSNQTITDMLLDVPSFSAGVKAHTRLSGFPRSVVMANEGQSMTSRLGWMAGIGTTRSGQGIEVR